MGFSGYTSASSLNAADLFVVEQSGTTKKVAWSVLGGSGVSIDRGYIDAVDGASGYANVSGTVAMDLDGARAFLHTMTGNITSLTFSNLDSGSSFATSWVWSRAIDGTGGYALSGTPSVTWTDGSTWDDLDLTADAVNIVVFVRIGATTFATLLSNGTVSLEPYVLSFAADGEQLIGVTRAETIDGANVSNVEADGTTGTGTVNLYKNDDSVAFTTATSFDAGDVLKVEVTGSSTPSAVAIPRTA